MNKSPSCKCYKSVKEKNKQCPHKSKKPSIYCGLHKTCKVDFEQSGPMPLPAFEPSPPAKTAKKKSPVRQAPPPPFELLPPPEMQPPPYETLFPPPPVVKGKSPVRKPPSPVKRAAVVDTSRCMCYKSTKEQNVQCPHKAKGNTHYCGTHKNCGVIFGQTVQPKVQPKAQVQSKVKVPSPKKKAQSPPKQQLPIQSTLLLEHWNLPPQEQPLAPAIMPSQKAPSPKMKAPSPPKVKVPSPKMKAPSPPKVRFDSRRAKSFDITVEQLRLIPTPDGDTGTLAEVNNLDFPDGIAQVMTKYVVAHPEIKSQLSRGDVIWIVDFKDQLNNDGRFFWDGKKVISQEDADDADISSVPSEFLVPTEFPPRYWTDESQSSASRQCWFDLERFRDQIINTLREGDLFGNKHLFSTVGFNGRDYYIVFDAINYPEGNTVAEKIRILKDNIRAAKSPQLTMYITREKLDRSEDPYPEDVRDNIVAMEGIYDDLPEESSLLSGEQIDDPEVLKLVERARKAVAEARARRNPKL